MPTQCLTFADGQCVLTRHLVSEKHIAGAVKGTTLSFGIRELDVDPVAVLALAVLLDQVDTQPHVFDVLAA